MVLLGELEDEAAGTWLLYPVTKPGYSHLKQRFVFTTPERAANIRNRFKL